MTSNPHDTSTLDPKALEAALIEFEGYEKHGGRDDVKTAARLLARQVRAYLAALSDPLPARGEVVVKPLEWYPPTDHPQDMEDSAILMAHGLGGRYAISPVTSLRKGGTGHLLWWAADEFAFDEFYTIEDAKVAAQSDFNKNILGCLE